MGQHPLVMAPLLSRLSGKLQLARNVSSFVRQNGLQLTSVAHAREVESLRSDVTPAAYVHSAPRREKIKAAKPFSSFLTDNFSRQHDYLRISITERCNLRCTYCMPEEGVPLSPPSELLTNPEISYLSALFVSQGVSKIRLTGGEPTIRRDILPLMHSIGNLRSKGLRELCLTTNGIALYKKLDSMVEAGLTGINLSLDTLDPFQFQILTRRKGFEVVLKSVDRILEMNKLGAGIKLKLNCVVMRGINEREIIPFVELGREKDIEVRFIEYMPFDGNKWSKGKMFSYQEMLALIRTKYSGLEKVHDHINNTSKTFQVPGFVGRIGFITSMTHNFCGSCNRLRITSDGNLKVCLFGNAEVSLRDILRKGNGGKPIDEQSLEAIKRAERDRRQLLPDYTGELGYAPLEQELLELIGLAVKRKKEMHAGMGQLENMKNRPMILIDKCIASAIFPCHHVYPERSNQVQYCLPSSSVSWFELNKQRKMSLYRSIPVRMLISSPHSHHFGHFFSTTSQLKPSASIPTSIVPFSTRASSSYKPTSSLPHLTSQSTIHVIPIGDKESTPRSALAVGHIVFSNPAPLPLVRAHALRKGDVLSVARVAAIMAVKRTSDLIPLCHNGVPVEGVSVKVEAVDGSGTQQESAAPDPEIDYNPPWQEENSLDEDESFPISPHGGIRISVRVDTTAKTGVEMEALAGVAGAGLTIIDMCKSVDRQLKMEGVRVVWKRGGKSGGGGNKRNHLVYEHGPGMDDPPEIRARRDIHLKDILDAMPNTDPKPGQLNAWDDEEYYKDEM